MKFLRIIAPPGIIALSLLGAWILWVNRTKPEQTIPMTRPRLVMVAEVNPEDIQLRVRTHGTVRAHTESDLIAEVSARVVSVTSAFAEGSFFKNGEVLLQLDPRDYELALERKKADVARAQHGLSVEEAEAKASIAEWLTISPDQPIPELVAHKPQLAEAVANLAASRAELEVAQLNLARTTIVAPYAGRIRKKHVDKGEFINRGTKMAELYTIDYAEIRLPLPDEELAFVDLPIDFHGYTPQNGRKFVQPAVEVHTRFAGQRHTWQGTIVRTEGELDPKSRMVHAIARIDDPYELEHASPRPPLLIGMFVEAEILGHRLIDVFAVPRSVMRGKDSLLTVDSKNRLRIVTVEVLRYDRDKVYIRKGLKSGDRICLTPLDTATDGTLVRTQDAGATK